MRRLLIATLFATVSGAALAQAPGSCSLDGLATWPHPADLEARPRAEWPKPKGNELCTSAGTSVRKVGDKILRFSFAVISRPGSDEKIGAFVAIDRLEGEKEIRLGRFVVPLDLVQGRTGAHGVQVVEQAGTLFVSLFRPETDLFAITADRVERQANAGWYGEMIRSLPPEESIGRMLHFDLENLTAYVFANKAKADDPAQPASAFAPGRVMKVDLDWNAGKLVVKATRTVPPSELPYAEPSEDEDERRQDITRRIGALPKGVEMCWLSAWSADKDPRGLNVRAEPSAKAAILGQLPPPMKDPDVGETLAKELTIIGYKDGWFLIDTKIDDEGATATPGRKRWFSGRGWVNARMVGARTAHSDLGEHKLFAAPTPFSHWTVGREKNGDPLTGDSELARIHACSFDWALVESAGGQRGWRRRLCSNQLTTCP